MSVTEKDVNTFVFGMANTFSLLGDVLAEDEATAGEFVRAFVDGEKEKVEQILREVSIEMDYERTDPDRYRLSFRIGRLGAALEIVEAPGPVEAE